MFDTVKVHTDSRGVAEVILSRPEKRNAMSGQMISELSALAEALAADSSVRVIVLGGAGGYFCAGADLGWMKAQVAADGPTRRIEAKKLANMLGAWNHMPKPVIARVEGPCMGGGVGLVCIADVAVSDRGAKFGLTETRLGLLPATIGPYVIARMGEGRARQVFMSARVFGAPEAERLGLVQCVDDLDDAVENEVSPYLSCAPGAVAEAKALALRLGSAPDQNTVSASIDALVTRWDSDEAEEGIAAFFEKRNPAWVK